MQDHLAPHQALNAQVAGVCCSVHAHVLRRLVRSGGPVTYTELGRETSGSSLKNVPRFKLFVHFRQDKSNQVLERKESGSQTMIPCSRSPHAPAGVVRVKLALWDLKHGIVVDTCSPRGQSAGAEMPEIVDPSQSRALFLGHPSADNLYYRVFSIWSGVLRLSLGRPAVAAALRVDH